MMRSIRNKLFLQIATIILFFAGLNWFINANFLERYYIHQKKNLLVEQAQYINEINQGNYQEIARELKKIEEVHSVNIIIISSHSRIRYSSNSRIIDEAVFIPEENSFREFIPSMPPPEIRQKSIITRERIELGDGSYFEMQNERHLNMDFLAYYTQLDTGDTIEIKVILNAISESAAIANKFIYYTGLLVLLLSSLWAYITSKQFTRPILEMNAITTKMAELNFNEKCNIQTADEIGQLGASINYLSQQLNTALTDLSIKNKRLEKEIERERKIDEMRKEFVSNVSHELRTPISLIGGYAEGLKLNILKNEAKKNFYCDVIIDEAKKMNALVGDLLDLSCMESGAYKLDKQIFCIDDLIKQIVEKYQHIFIEKKIKMTFDVPENLWGYADILRTDQILVNYINNGISHVDENKIIKITSSKEEQRARIAVFNSGKPISEAEREKIWHSFYKADQARTRQAGGYGLGLSIVKVIQESDHQQYGVENVEGGVEFWFTVDYAPPPN